MARGDFELRGSRQMQRRLRQLVTESGDAVARGLRLEAEFIMTRAKKASSGKGVPVDFGVLRSSGHVQDVERHGKELSVTMGFGGPAGAGNLGETNKETVGYALVQHEALHFSHRIGEPKYLERPMRDALPGMPNRIADTIRKEALKD